MNININVEQCCKTIFNQKIDILIRKKTINILLRYSYHEDVRDELSMILLSKFICKIWLEPRLWSGVTNLCLRCLSLSNITELYTEKLPIAIKKYRKVIPLKLKYFRQYNYEWSVIHIALNIIILIQRNKIQSFIKSSIRCEILYLASTLPFLSDLLYSQCASIRQLTKTILESFSIDQHYMSTLWPNISTSLINLVEVPIEFDNILHSILIPVFPTTLLQMISSFIVIPDQSDHSLFVTMLVTAKRMKKGYYFWSS